MVEGKWRQVKGKMQGAEGKEKDAEGKEKETERRQWQVTVDLVCKYNVLTGSYGLLRM